jgi:hypothetical protein
MSSTPTGARLPKRGAMSSPRHALAAATPYLQPPPSAPPHHIVIPHKLSSWGNFDHGDCVTAEEAFAKACYKSEIFISDEEVIQWATSHGALEGAYLNQVLEWMQADGFKQQSHTYDDGRFYSLDWTRPAILNGAIYEGPVKIGVAANQLETAWRTTGGKSGWFGVGFKPDTNEDHCVSLCGYGAISWLAHKLDATVPSGVDGTKPGYALFTWDSIGIIDQPSMVAITHEAWLRNPTTVVK